MANNNQQQSAFVDTRPVAVFLPEDAEIAEPARNIIYIRPKMGYGIKNKVLDALAPISGRGRFQDLRVFSANTNLLFYNIVRWNGPMFVGHPVTRENIDLLNPELPLLKLVLQEINDRNQDPAAPAAEVDLDPNLGTASTSMDAGEQS